MLSLTAEGKELASCKQGLLQGNTADCSRSSVHSHLMSAYMWLTVKRSLPSGAHAMRSAIRRILKLSNDKFQISSGFGSNSLLQWEWQMLSHIRKGYKLASPSPPKSEELMLHVLQHNDNSVSSLKATSLWILAALFSPAVTIIPLSSFTLQP